MEFPVGNSTTGKVGDWSRPLTVRTQNSILIGALLLAGILLYYFGHLYKLYFIPLVVILLFLGYLNWLERQRISWSYCAILLAGYGWLLIAISWSPDKSEGLYRITIEAVYFLFALFPVLAKNFCVDDIKLRLLQGAALACCATALTAFVFLGKVLDPSAPTIRTTYGTIFLTALPALVYLYSRRKSLLSLFLLVAIGAISLVLGSRTLLLFGPFIFSAAVVVVARERIFAKGMMRQRIGAAILLVPLIAVTAGEVVSSNAYSRLRNQTSTNIGQTVLREQFDSQHAEDIERRILTFVSINMFLQNPIFGAGYGSTSYYVQRVSRFKTGAHGLFLMLPAETGLIGVSIYSLMILRSLNGFRLKLRSEPDPDGRYMVWIELLTFVAILLVGLSSQIYNDFYFYMFLGTGLHYRSLYHRHSL